MFPVSYRCSNKKTMASGSSKRYMCNCLNCKGQEAVSYSTVYRHENVYGKSPGYEPEEMDGDFHVDLGQS